MGTAPAIPAANNAASFVGPGGASTFGGSANFRSNELGQDMPGGGIFANFGSAPSGLSLLNGGSFKVLQGSF